MLRIEIAKFLRSGNFIDVWAVLLFLSYAIPGYCKYTQEASLIYIVALNIVYSLLTWMILAGYKNFRYKDFSFRGHAKALPGIIIINLSLFGYLLNYQYSNQSLYVYAVPVYCLMFMSICAFISKKIYFRKIKKGNSEKVT